MTRAAAADTANMDLDVALLTLRAEIAERTMMIHRLLREHCPGGKRAHHYVQHRDGLMPWCPHCSYTALGTLPGSDTNARGHVTRAT